jgi:hypothetical protein
MTAVHDRGAGHRGAMIPGALEIRPRPLVVDTGVPRGRLGPHPFPAAPDDLERREREREGGGAPRDLPPGSSWWDRLQRALLNLTERFIRLMATGPSSRNA